MPRFQVAMCVACFLAMFGLVPAIAGAQATRAQQKATVDEIGATELSGPQSARPTELRVTKHISGDLNGVTHSNQKILGSARINCKKQNCTIEAIMTVQASSATDDNLYAVCLRISGQLDDLGCTISGELFSNEILHATTTIGLKTRLPRGKYTADLLYNAHSEVKIYHYYAVFRGYY